MSEETTQIDLSASEDLLANNNLHPAVTEDSNVITIIANKAKPLAEDLQQKIGNFVSNLTTTTTSSSGGEVVDSTTTTSASSSTAITIGKKKKQQPSSPESPLAPTTATTDNNLFSKWKEIAHQFFTTTIGFNFVVFLITSLFTLLVSLLIIPPILYSLTMGIYLFFNTLLLTFCCYLMETNDKLQNSHKLHVLSFSGLNSTLLVLLLVLQFMLNHTIPVGLWEPLIYFDVLVWIFVMNFLIHKYQGIETLETFRADKLTTNDYTASLFGAFLGPALFHAPLYAVYVVALSTYFTSHVYLSSQTTTVFSAMKLSALYAMEILLFAFLYPFLCYATETVIASYFVVPRDAPPEEKNRQDQDWKTRGPWQRRLKMTIFFFCVWLRTAIPDLFIIFTFTQHLRIEFGILLKFIMLICLDSIAKLTLASNSIWNSFEMSFAHQL